MGFTKTQSVESTEVLTPEEHRIIEAKLHRIGKLNARDLTDEQRATVLQSE